MPSARTHISADDAQRSTTLGLSRAAKVFIIVVSPLVGLVLGWLLPRVADWASEQRWVPLHGLLRLIASWDAAWVPLMLMAAGILAGVAFILIAFDSIVQVEINDTQVTFVQGEHREVVPRAVVRGAFYDHKHLVLVDGDGRELYRGQPEASAGAVATAFQVYGYRWLEADPFAEAYRRWVPGTDELPAGADALFRAREGA